MYGLNWIIVMGKRLTVTVPKCASVSFTFSLVGSIYILILLAIFLILTNEHIKFYMNDGIELSTNSSQPIIEEGKSIVGFVFKKYGVNRFEYTNSTDKKVVVKVGVRGDIDSSNKQNSVVYCIHNLIQ